MTTRIVEKRSDYEVNNPYSTQLHIAFNHLKVLDLSHGYPIL
jgi:hypothetical protein